MFAGSIPLSLVQFQTEVIPQTLIVKLSKSSCFQSTAWSQIALVKDIFLSHSSLLKKVSEVTREETGQKTLRIVGCICTFCSSRPPDINYPLKCSLQYVTYWPATFSLICALFNCWLQQYKKEKRSSWKIF